MKIERRGTDVPMLGNEMMPCAIRGCEGGHHYIEIKIPTMPRPREPTSPPKNQANDKAAGQSTPRIPAQ